MLRTKEQTAVSFITESNYIEGITIPPTDSDIRMFLEFMELPRVTTQDMVAFVKQFEPSAYLRDSGWINSVQVGSWVAPSSGPMIRHTLDNILHMATPSNAFFTHVLYEELHPFTDCNGRSGRMLWAHQMGYARLKLGFLHKFYHQSLHNFQRRNK